jgi:Xaa-Pro aminopeptidase
MSKNYLIKDKRMLNMFMEELKHYQKVQDAARYTLDNIIEFIKPGITEVGLVKKCDELQRSAGVDDYWYKGLPAVVLAGDHTALAISRTPYVPSDYPVQENDLITIDLNPSINGYCGDYARTYYIEAGVTKRTPQYDKELLAGADAQKHLHSVLMQLAHADMTFNDLYQIMRVEIDQRGFEQLDYLGHGVQKDMQHLNFIAPDVMCSLGDVGFFTLEPQIRLKGGRYGFKHENIYYFNGVGLQEL